MVNEDSKSPSASYPMVGGDGPTSYAQNSYCQRAVINAAKELINECIKNKLNFKNLNVTSRFLIADYGCSIGPNTFLAMQNVVDAIKLKYHSENPKNPPLEFQVYFNDHSENDFNTLFKTLPPNKDYFAAGVPGGFHQQLLPYFSLHFMHCSYALHWLSAVPTEIKNSSSPAWNKGSIHCSGLKEDVAKAYLAQFNHDMDKFLNARAKEIASDGLMMILMPGLPEGVLMSQTKLGILWDYLGTALTDMAQMGIVTEEKVDSFNLPIYYPTAKELEGIIRKNGYFNIEKMEQLDIPMINHTGGPEAAVIALRAVFEGLFTKHFGDEKVVDKIFQHFAKIVVDNLSNLRGTITYNIDQFVFLKRKIDCEESVITLS